MTAIVSALGRWFYNKPNDAAARGRGAGVARFDWVRMLPFIGIHVGCSAVIWVGASPAAVLVCAASYGARMFAITGFYHRYFSHRTFSTSRPVQLLFAVLGAAATQRGPLWWAAHHRNHHRRADRSGDPHRPADGLAWAHIGWFLADDHVATDSARVRDWHRFPELVWLDRFDTVVPVLYAAAMYGLGA